MATEFDNSQHWGFFLTGLTLTSDTGKYVRMSELTLAALRAAGFLDNMVDGIVAPATDKLWLDKNYDPAILKEWDPVGAAWVQVTSQTLFGRVPFRGPWEASPIYRVGDLVFYGTNIWIARQPSQNHAPVDDAYWDIFIDGSSYAAGDDERIVNALQAFDSRDAASAMDLSAYSVVRINRFTSSSVVAPAVYEEVLQPGNVEPAHAGKFQSDDGKWWEISKGQRITPTMFGATGLGLVDDTAAFMDAITAVVALGVPLRDDGGIYLVSGTTGAVSLRVPDGADFTFHGAGRSKTVIKSVSPAAIMGGVDLEGFDLQGVRLLGSGSAARVAWQRGVYLHGAKRVSIRDCHLLETGDGAITLGKTGFGGSDQLPDSSRQTEIVQILGNLIEDCSGTVAIVTKYVGAKQMIVSGNIIRGSCASGISIESEDGAIGVEYAEQIVVSGNVINDCSYLRTEGLSSVAWGITVTEQARFISVAGNVVTGVYGDTIAAGIEVGTSPTQTDTEARNISVVGNTVSNITKVSGNSNGIIIDCGDVDIKNLAVNGNVVDDAVYGVNLSSAAGSKTLGTIRTLALQGNVISDCQIGIFSSNVGGSGEIPIENASIDGNVVTECAIHGIQLAVRSGSIVGNVANENGGNGITVLSTSGKIVVANNSACRNSKNGIGGEGNHVSYLGNTCMNNGQDGTESYGIRHSTGTNCIIINNRCGDDQGTATQDYGIRAPAGSTVKGNELIGNVSASVWGGVAAHNTGTYDAGGNRTA